MTQNIQNIQNTENIVKIDIKGFYDLCNRLGNLEQENEKLTKDNKILSDELAYFMQRTADLEERCSELSKENLKLKSENADLSFSRNFLGVPMTPEDIAIEAAEDGYRPYDGDDF